MRDNLSIVILMILLVLVMIMFPLYNYFERQDDMSYSLALKATTNFVDEVLNSGYVDQEMYNKLVDSLSATGNIYDIQLEAHRSYKVLDPDNKGTYIEKHLIDYNDDIFGPITDTKAKVTDRQVLNNIYKLNKGDEFYVKLKNSSTTMAGAIFNSLITTSSKDRIVVDYGGVIKNNAWEKIDATYTSKINFADNIYYIEDRAQNGNYYVFIYFKSVPPQGYTVKFSNIGNGYYKFYKEASDITKMPSKISNSSISITQDGVLAIFGNGTNNIVSDHITIKSGNTVQVAKTKKYPTDYKVENLLINLEEEYKFNDFWPSMYLANQYINGYNNPSIVNIAELYSTATAMYDTKINRDFSDSNQKAGYTMEAVFWLNNSVLTDTTNSCIIGDWQGGGGGIHYLPPKKRGGSGFESIPKSDTTGVIIARAYINGGYKDIWFEYDGVGNKDKVSFTSKYDGKYTTLILYLNGVEKVSKKYEGKISAPKNKITLAVGGNKDNNGKLQGILNGTIASVQVYKSALTATEIQKNYSVSASKYQL